MGAMPTGDTTTTSGGAADSQTSSGGRVVIKLSKRPGTPTTVVGIFHNPA